MKRLIVILAMLTGMAPAEMTLSIAGLRVVGEEYSTDPDAMNAEIRAFNWSRGTSVALLVKSSDLKIVALNEEASKITAFTDDKGTDFLKVKSKYSNDPFKFEWSTVSADGKALGTTLASEGVPAKGAATISLKGSLVVTTGSEFAETKSSEVILAKDAEFEAGGTKFKLSEAGKPKWGEASLEITLETSQNLDAIQGIRFYDSAGKEIEAESTGSGSFGFGGKMTYSRSYQFKEKHKKLVVGLSKWTDLKEVDVPVDLTFGAGL